MNLNENKNKPNVDVQKKTAKNEIKSKTEEEESHNTTPNKWITTTYTTLNFTVQWKTKNKNY